MSTQPVESDSVLDAEEYTPAASQAVTTQMATTRQAQEVQAAMIVAKKFPRDEDAAVTRILKACKRPRLAEVAAYEYKRGGSLITGPSIRMAEVLAQNWGNCDFGIIELERRVGESVAMAYCWDLETNTRQTKVFQVRHIRDTKEGPKALRDERDIYEHVANLGARRVRACILGIIPGDVVDTAMEACEKTIAGQGGGEPITDRVRKMLAAFSDLGVTQAMIEAKLGHKTTAITPIQLARLGRIFTSIRDGVSGREEHFDLAAAAQPAPSSLDELADRFAGEGAEKKPAKSKKQAKGKQQRQEHPGGKEQTPASTPAAAASSPPDEEPPDEGDEQDDGEEQGTPVEGEIAGGLAPRGWAERTAAFIAESEDFQAARRAYDDACGPERKYEMTEAEHEQVTNAWTARQQIETDRAKRNAGKTRGGQGRFTE